MFIKTSTLITKTHHEIIKLNVSVNSRNAVILNNKEHGLFLISDKNVKKGSRRIIKPNVLRSYISSLPANLDKVKVDGVMVDRSYDTIVNTLIKSKVKM